MKDIRQTPLYASYMRRLGWQVETIAPTNIFIKKLPLVGSYIKVQRPTLLPFLSTLYKLRRKYHAFSSIVEPAAEFPLPAGAQYVNSGSLPTKTVRIDLIRPVHLLSQSLAPAKRRAIRKAERLGVQIEISQDIEAFIRLKNRSAGLLGFLTTHHLHALWEVFSPHHACVVMAAHPSSLLPLAGILLIYYEHIAYYWSAVATHEGKMYAAPSLVTWAAIKYAKRQKCRVFDFEGVYDERFPRENRDWVGFTKFKLGFGGEEVYFPKPFRLS